MVSGMIDLKKPKHSLWRLQERKEFILHKQNEQLCHTNRIHVVETVNSIRVYTLTCTFAKQLLNPLVVELVWLNIKLKITWECVVSITSVSWPKVGGFRKVSALAGSRAGISPEVQGRPCPAWVADFTIHWTFVLCSSVHFAV